MNKVVKKVMANLDKAVGKFETAFSILQDEVDALIAAVEDAADEADTK